MLPEYGKNQVRYYRIVPFEFERSRFLPKTIDMRNFILLQILIVPMLVSGQLFTEITYDTNPIVDHGSAASGAYNGCAWIDYNNDGLLDLFWVRGGLFRNDGEGGFTEITDSHLRTDAGFGNTWADYNNDGFIDCFISGGNTRGSSLHQNNGDGTFTKIYAGPLLDSLALRGWGSAFADFNNDTYPDIVIAAPYGFAGVTDGNKLLMSDGAGSFIRLDTSIICDVTAPYTVPSWSDFDFDGDMDCFIGSGPANGTVAPDYLFKNQLTETGVQGYFTRLIEYPIGTDDVDGQIWNWIDYDNDGDLDAYLTNYIGISGGIGMENNLYRNDEGIFTKMTEAEAGAIVSDQGLSLASVWEDFDNDGDLDCFITNDGAAQCKYYENNNDGSFTTNTTEPIVQTTASFYSASAGDYDRDGDLDLFVSATGSGKALYQNNASDNGNSWVNFNLKGNGPGIIIGSNRSAIGARVRAKAEIGGTDVWQMREVSAQNSFNGMNSLNVEFGFGDATIIDSLIIEWPSGIVDYCTNLPVNNFYEVQETFCPEEILSADMIESVQQIIAMPNPSADLFTIQYTLNSETEIEIYIVDTMGKMIHRLQHQKETAGIKTIQFDASRLSSGIYYFIIKSVAGLHSIKLDVKSF